MTTPRPRLRAAIVGAGLMGRWHAHAVARAGHIVAVVVDTDRARASALAARHTRARIAAELEAAGELDVVHVCTPLATHAPLVRAALALGAHVIVEKPLAIDGAETAALLGLAAAGGRMLVPVHQYLYQTGVRHAAEVVRELGPLLHVDVATCTAGADGLPPAGRDALAIDVLPHPFALLARLVSPALAEVGWAVRRPAAGELRVDGVLVGTTVSLLVSTHGRPTLNAARLIGERGTIHLDLFHGFATVERGRAGRLGKIARPLAAGAATVLAATANLVRRAAARGPAYPGLRPLVQIVYEAAQRGGVSPIGAGETLAVAHALDAVRACLARDGVALPAGSSIAAAPRASALPATRA